MSNIQSSVYISIKDLSKELDLPSHVLRFWETKFKCIKPIKRSGGCRYYRQVDVDYIKRIKHLLYEEKYTIKGAIALLHSDSHNKVNTHQGNAEVCETKFESVDNHTKQTTDVLTTEPKVPNQMETAIYLAKLKAIRDNLKLAVEGA